MISPLLLLTKLLTVSVFL